MTSELGATRELSIDCREPITLGADVGGKDAHAATNNHILALRLLLREECRGPYSQTIKEFALVLRVDGSVQVWGKSGVEGVRMQHKNSFATADIFVPREAWSTNDAYSFRRLLASEVTSALAKIVECAQRRGIEVSRGTLERDIDTAIAKFLMQ